MTQSRVFIRPGEVPKGQFIVDPIIVTDEERPMDDTLSELLSQNIVFGGIGFQHWRKIDLPPGTDPQEFMDSLPKYDPEAEKQREKARRKQEKAHAKADFEGMDPREFAEWLLDAALAQLCCGDSHMDYTDKAAFAHLFGVKKFDAYAWDSHEVTDEVRARLYAKLGIDG